MAAYTKGYQRRLKVGTAGSTPTTILENATDIDVNGPNEDTDTTTRGVGTSVPIHTDHVVQIVRVITFKCRFITTDALLATIITATKTGADIAMKVERQSGGETEYDGDVTVKLTSPGPLAGGMELEFEAKPSRDSGRDPVLS